MSGFSDMLTFLRKREGFSQKELADKIGVSRSAIGMYEAGEREPDFETLEALADTFNVNMNTLLGKSDAPIPSNAIEYNERHFAPIVGTIPAGYPATALQDIEGYEPIPYPDVENYFFLRVDGYSMINAGINPGDLVLIRRQDFAEPGQIVACRVNGDEATLKRYRPGSTAVVLMPENSKYEPKVVSAEDFVTGYASILGVAIQVRHNL